MSPRACRGSERHHEPSLVGQHGPGRNAEGFRLRQQVQAPGPGRGCPGVLAWCEAGLVGEGCLDRRGDSVDLAAVGHSLLEGTGERERPPALGDSR